MGFEPTEPAKAQRFSRPPDSTTLAPHRIPMIPDLMVGEAIPIKRPRNDFLDTDFHMLLEICQVGILLSVIRAMAP